MFSDSDLPQRAVPFQEMPVSSGAEDVFLEGTVAPIFENT